MTAKKIEAVNDLENKIMFVVGEAMGYNGFTKSKWKKKYEEKVLCQIVNKLIRNFLKQAMLKIWL